MENFRENKLYSSILSVYGCQDHHIPIGNLCSLASLDAILIIDVSKFQKP